MLNRRQLLGAMGAAGIGIAATACSTGGGQPAPGATAAPTGELKGTVHIVTPEFAGTDGKEAFEGKILKAFTDKHPGVTFQVDYTPWDKLNEKLSTLVAGGQPSDLLMTGMGWTEPFAHKKVLTKLDKNAVLGDAKVLDALVKQGSFNGDMYAMPFLLESRPFAYRKDLFEKFQISTTEPKSMEEFNSLLEEVKSKSGLVPLDMLGQNLRQIWGQMIFAFGGTQFSPDGMSITFDQEPGVKALQWMVDLQNKGLSDFNFKVPTGQPSAYQQDKTLMAWGSSGAWPQWLKQTPQLTEEGKLGIMLMPTVNGSKVLYQGGTLVGLSTRSQNSAAATAVMQHLITPDALTQASLFSGKVPARSDLPPNPELAKNKLLDFSVDNLQYSVTDGGTPAWMEIRGKMDPELEAAVTGKKSVADTIASLKKIAEDAIGRIK
ncbi:extracellular solute-binding protein [Propioniciclava coleopterorum]|uniref:Extracellular solute-binding protein n=1 Tax=Propioniciclava coleopterorum TaxID=2714937 RepID=A0A6G7YAF4_9ACTN|nr:extracellular solute-binding protein [Propioniciclava coleopterorum]QIK73618.1 extracellular solute-binding protein [Propioniciclava coleopterorum]